MYTIGTFTNTTEAKQPGVYTRLAANPLTNTASTVSGGLALPWVSYNYQVAADPSEIAANTLSTTPSKFKLANPDTFKRVSSAILASTSTIHLCPYNLPLKKKVGEPATDKNPSGWSDDGNVHVTATIVYPDTKTPTQAAHQPLHVKLTVPTDNKVKVTVFFPFVGNFKTKEIELDLSKTVGGQSHDITIEFDDAKEGPKVLDAVYKSITLTFIIKQTPTRETTVVVGGGAYLHEGPAKTAIDTAVNRKTHDGLGAGSLIAYPYKSNDYTDVGNEAFLYIKNTAVPAGTDCFAVAEMKNGMVTLTLYTHDVITDVTTEREINSKSYAIIDKTGGGTQSKDSIRTVITSLPEVVSLPKKEGGSGDAWDAQLTSGDTVRIGFASAHPLDDTKDKHDPVLFMPVVGQTPAAVTFFVPTTNKLGKDRADTTAAYRKIQTTFVENAGTYCPATQLVMDETWLVGCSIWSTTTSPLTISCPSCVSVAGDSRGGIDSLQNSAYIAGIMAKCDVMSNASASVYPGSDLKVYGQKDIEHMLNVGVMTWHVQGSKKMVYIDNSSYIRTLGSYDKIDYPKTFERNLTVRAVNMFRRQASANFIAHYFEQNRYGRSAESMIGDDLLRLLETLAAYEVIQPPSRSDITVSHVASRTYMAEVRMRMIDTVEVLLITLEV